jgi:hypothetical protein
VAGPVGHRHVMNATTPAAPTEQNNSAPVRNDSAPAPTNSAAALVEAYHVIFDVKDVVYDDGQLRYEAYEVLQKLATLMTSLGFDVPDRYDGQGRPA